jgi:hypothetical protein
VMRKREEREEWEQGNRRVLRKKEKWKERN